MSENKKNFKDFYFLFTIYTPPNMIIMETICLMPIVSPSIIPQRIATIGIRYVTDEANKALVFLTKILKRIVAMAVPPIAKRTT